MTNLIRKSFLSSSLVKDIVKYPICLDCVHYKEYKQSNPYDEMYETRNLGKCSLYGKQNVVTGQIHLIDALICRADESKCGEKGKYFKYKWNKKQT